MELEAFFPFLGRKNFFNEGPAFYKCAICQCPPIYCKARRDSVTFWSLEDREKVQEKVHCLLDKLSHSHYREYTREKRAHEILLEWHLNFCWNSASTPRFLQERHRNFHRNDTVIFTGMTPCFLPERHRNFHRNDTVIFTGTTP